MLAFHADDFGVDKQDRQIASIGAMVVIAELAVEPLSQQLVVYPLRSVQDAKGIASIGLATYWTEPSQVTGSTGVCHLTRSFICHDRS